MDKIPWNILIIGSLTLGLAPFVPEPHLLEKLRMLFQGDLAKPIDIFDLVMHGAFPALLLLKIVIPSKSTPTPSDDKE
ncbi:RND transporter [Candidatus Halobeggiatoa sp. HSG11]|nr:RND transporter [Candidatus Halobeggiatoa sp. HSG11]